MTEPISQDQAEGYMQIAALVCQDLDVLLEIAEIGRLDRDALVRQIRKAHRRKEQVIADATVRKQRYEAACVVWGAVAAGLVRSTPLFEEGSHGH